MRYRTQRPTIAEFVVNVQPLRCSYSKRTSVLRSVFPTLNLGAEPHLSSAIRISGIAVMGEVSEHDCDDGPLFAIS